MSLTHYDCVELQKKILEKNNLEIELPSNALLKCIFCKKKKNIDIYFQRYYWLNILSYDLKCHI